MKFLHISDLHLGKRLNEYSLIEDQRFILNQILKITAEEKPDGLLIAGDVYDKSVPSAEAVSLFDEFLVNLSKTGVKTFIISGNHDSPERLSFGSRLMDKSGIYISMVYVGKVEPITLYDEFGALNVYMLPFVKPVHVKRYFGEEIDSYTKALSVAIENMKVNENERNLLITHQFVTGSSRTDSEDLSVGGTDNVDVCVFDPFDYVALGHIHRPQKCVKDTVRYSGTPLKYSLSEAQDQKSISIVEMGKKGEISVRLAPLTPLRDLTQIKGKYQDLMQKSFYEGTTLKEDYVYITLTDDEEIPDVMAKLRTVYRNVTALRYDNKRTQAKGGVEFISQVENKTPLELFGDFYRMQNNDKMSAEQNALVQNLIEKIWGEEL
ncbi:MAG: exonuclease SbcCD subunit D [Clostridia bacterium]|nr:exonuclease SbcCD subunit D [Clostridia bacterium]